MNYINPKIEVRNTPEKGKGLFAKEKILKGELIDRTEDVQILTKEEIKKKPNFILWKQLCYEINDNEEECPLDINNPSAGFLMNHSCDPNVGIKDNWPHAMRDIEKDEEVTYDDVMTDSGNYDMECKCRTKLCRGRIKGSDWKLPALQKRYKGYFQKNIQEKMDSFKTE